MTSEPTVRAQRVAQPEATLELEIPDDLEYFSGHFEGAPIVPGVVQILWAVDAARRHLGARGDVVGMEALKFQRALLPGAVVTLALKWLTADGKLYFSYTSAATRYSSGRLLLRPVA